MLLGLVLGSNAAQAAYWVKVVDRASDVAGGDNLVTSMWIDRDMKVQRTVAEYKAEIAARLDAFARSLPTQLDCPAISLKKLPGNAMWYRETMIWRFTELAQEALDNLNRQRFAAAMVLTRAAVETSAGLWYLHAKIMKAIKADELGDLDDVLRRLNVGYKDPRALADNLPEAVSVLTFGKHVEKDIGGYTNAYATLCEYAHPNYEGAACLYSLPHVDTGLVDFGANIRTSDSHEVICVMNLSVAVMMFNHSYSAFADHLPLLVALCEKGAEKK